MHQIMHPSLPPHNPVPLVDWLSGWWAPRLIGFGVCVCAARAESRGLWSASLRLSVSPPLSLSLSLCLVWSASSDLEGTSSGGRDAQRRPGRGRPGKAAGNHKANTLGEGCQRTHYAATQNAAPPRTVVAFRLGTGCFRHRDQTHFKMSAD